MWHWKTFRCPLSQQAVKSFVDTHFPPTKAPVIQMYRISLGFPIFPNLLLTLLRRSNAPDHDTIDGIPAILDNFDQGIYAYIIVRVFARITAYAFLTSSPVSANACTQHHIEMVNKDMNSLVLARSGQRVSLWTAGSTVALWVAGSSAQIIITDRLGHRYRLHDWGL